MFNYFCQYNESKWGPKQHLTTMTLIVWTKKKKKLLCVTPKKETQVWINVMLSNDDRMFSFEGSIIQRNTFFFLHCKH